MSTCKKCGAELLPEASFCHVCGTRVEEKGILCPACGTENPPGSRFCSKCGLNFMDQRPPHNIFEQPPHVSTMQEITDLFFDVFQKKVEEEQGLENYPAYLQRFEESDFKQTFELRIRQLAEEIDQIKAKSVRPQSEANQLLDKALNGLSDFFIIRYCQDLNKIPIPEVILKYETVDVNSVDLYQMICDFLDLEHSDETIYTNFLEMDVEKLKNAGNSFLFPAKEERIFFICDQSMLGSLKEGFAMTNRAIYWKAPFEKARSVSYSQLQSVEHEKDWLRINGHFFNANPVMNVRLMKLLRKMMG